MWNVASLLPKAHKKTSTYQCLKKEPLNFQHSFCFLAKTGLLKCHAVAKNSRGELLRNIDEVCFKVSGVQVRLYIAQETFIVLEKKNTNLKKEVENVNGCLPCLSFLMACSSRICFFSRCKRGVN